MPGSAAPTTSMIGQSELSIFKKVISRKRWHQDVLQKKHAFFPGWKASKSHTQSRHLKRWKKKTPLLVLEMVATASATTPSAPPLATEGAAKPTGLEGTERPMP